MKILSPGKFWNLSRCALPQGGFSILALDHRNNLRKSINPQNPQSVPDETLSSLKLKITHSIAKNASALLIDPEVGLFPVVSQNALPKSVGLIVALEATGYVGETTQRVSKVLDYWSVKKVQRLGANAVKLLVYYHPDSSTTKEIEGLVNDVNEICNETDLPFILEILTYSIDNKTSKLKGSERKKVVIESARRLSKIGGDLLKLEFPADIAGDTDQQSWINSCTDLTAVCQAPWVLLSASVDFPTYLDQVRAACKAGAVGIAAGRAVWKEAVQLEGSAQQEFLIRDASTRLKKLSRLVSELSPKFERIYKIEKTSYQSY
jgi:tagatose-1,6-bisphosphate aldolase